MTTGSPVADAIIAIAGILGAAWGALENARRRRAEERERYQRELDERTAEELAAVSAEANREFQAAKRRARATLPPPKRTRDRNGAGH